MTKRNDVLRGPLPVGGLTAKGYRRAGFAGRQRMIHGVVWERQNGPIPAGYCIHHRDGDKQNNAIDNLECLTPTAHKRLHGGCQMRGGVWFKPCSLCGIFKPITDEFWYFVRGWLMGRRCKRCHIRLVVDRKRRRRMVSREETSLC